MRNVNVGVGALLAIFSLLLVPTAHAQCESSQLAAPTAADAFAGDQFGVSVAASGGLAVVGASEEEFGTGSAYVFEFNGTQWLQVAKLIASDGSTGDKFGISVGVHGDVIVVGAYQPSPAEQPGKAYVFEKPGSGWADMTETAQLTASDAANNDNFGFAVDIDGTTIVVGAYLDDDSGTNSGSAYVFEKSFIGWESTTETAKLTASDANAMDQFGIDVAIAGNTIAVGADRDSDGAYQAGSAYVFVKPDEGWVTSVETGKLTVANPVDFDRCGLSVGVGDGFVVAGAWGDDQAAEKAGVLHIFERPLDGWANMTATAELTASDAASGDHLGWSVDVDGKVIVAGAPANLFDGSGFGAVYLYLQPSTGWTDAAEDARLESSTLVQDDEFGTAVAIGGSLVNVGARYFATGGYSNAGAAYLFGGAMDCNSNQELDLCEMVSGSGADSDGNGVLDECEGATAVPVRPESLVLGQNRPNPFNPSTEIRYSLPAAGMGSLRVFDLRGKLVRTLHDGMFQAGEGSLTWNGRDDGGRSVAGGVYLYRLEVGELGFERKMLLLK
jgi:hypothetical protein